MATVTEKARVAPNTLPVDVLQEVRRALEDSRFGEILDGRISERLAPIERQLAEIAGSLKQLGTAAAATKASAAGAGAAGTPASVPPATPPGNGVASILSTNTTSTGGTSTKLEADPRVPEPPQFRERNLATIGEWQLFDRNDPTTFITKPNQGTTNP